MSKPISTAILTGGLSRRMGEDKACLRLNGMPLALSIARILKRVTGDWPILVAKSPRKYASLCEMSASPSGAESGIRVVRDIMPQRCALSGIHAALHHARYSRVLITTCDQPFLSARLLAEMIRSPGDVVACEVDRRLQSFPVIFSKDLLGPIADSFNYGVLSVQENMFVSDFPTILDERRIRCFDPDLRTFKNLNTPSDLTPRIVSAAA